MMEAGGLEIFITILVGVTILMDDEKDVWGTSATDGEDFWGTSATDGEDVWGTSDMDGEDVWGTSEIEAVLKVGRSGCCWLISGIVAMDSTGGGGGIACSVGEEVCSSTAAFGLI